MRSGVLGILMVMAATPAVAQAAPSAVRQVMSGRCQPLTSLPVSLIQLIATPEHFDRKCVQVMGYLHLEFEGNGLFLNEDDFRHGITFNALWVDASDTRLFDETVNDTFAILAGEFRAKQHGHLGMFAGTLTDMTRVDPIRSRRRPYDRGVEPAR